MTLTFRNEGYVIPSGNAWGFRTMEPPRNFLSDVIADAVEIYGVGERDIKSASRTRHIVRARQYVFYHALKRTQMSASEIGRRVGDRNHATVLYGAYAHAKRHGLSYVYTSCWEGKNNVNYEGPEPTR